jgi:hypothetical protein
MPVPEARQVAAECGQFSLDPGAVVAEPEAIGGQNGAGLAAPVEIVDAGGCEREAGKGFCQGRSEVGVGRCRIKVREQRFHRVGVGQADRFLVGHAGRLLTAGESGLSPGILGAPDVAGGHLGDENG